MSVKDELFDLIEQLDPEQAEVAAHYVRRLLDPPADAHDEESASLSVCMQPLAASGHQFFTEPSTTLRELARQQGVTQVPSPDVLVGDFWPGDEPVDDFVAAVREWRRDGGHA